MNGKGSKPRPISNYQSYVDNWDDIFRKDSKVSDVVDRSKWKKLEDLTEHEFNTLKKMGFLWEFFPDAPELYKSIVR